MLSFYHGKSYAGVLSPCVTPNLLILFMTTVNSKKKGAKDRPFLCNEFQNV